MSDNEETSAGRPSKHVCFFLSKAGLHQEVTLLVQYQARRHDEGLKGCSKRSPFSYSFRQADRMSEGLKVCSKRSPFSYSIRQADRMSERLKVCIRRSSFSVADAGTQGKDQEVFHLQPQAGSRDTKGHLYM